ncbi:MAG: phage baseplate plug family protein [Weissella confusa]
MALRSYIPVNKNNLPEMFEFPFGNQTYIIGIDYNQFGGFFTVDLYTASREEIILGEKVVAGQRLWSDFVDPRLPAESVIPMDESDANVQITFDNLGDTTQLYIDNLDPEIVGDDSDN